MLVKESPPESGAEALHSAGEQDERAPGGDAKTWCVVRGRDPASGAVLQYRSNSPGTLQLVYRDVNCRDCPHATVCASSEYSPPLEEGAEEPFEWLELPLSFCIWTAWMQTVAVTGCRLTWHPDVEAMALTCTLENGETLHTVPDRAILDGRLLYESPKLLELEAEGKLPVLPHEAELLASWEPFPGS